MVLGEGSCYLYNEDRHLPTMRDFGYVMLVFCVHLVINSCSSWNCQKLAAAQILARAGDTVHHWRLYGPSITVQIIAPPPLSPAKLDRTLRWVLSLRPSASVVWAMLYICFTRGTDQGSEACAKSHLGFCKGLGVKYGGLDEGPCFFS